MERVIKAAIDRGASDLHVKAGDVFRARIDGELRPLTKQRLTPEQTKAIALELITHPAVRERIDTITDYDCSWGAPGIGRFRVNLLRQRSSFMIVLRAIPFDVPTFERLELPERVRTVAEAPSGLVLVTGPTGSGKSSTVAAFVHAINAGSHRHVVTIESPIEFLHRDLNCSVTQREVGVDTDAFAVGLRATLRQDPDVIVSAELPDAETADAALMAAETGRLVIAIMHTPDVTSTVARFVALFPGEEREVTRARLADQVQAIVSQRLLPRRKGEGRQAVVELMLATDETRAVLAERGRAGAMYRAIAEGREGHGMQTLDQHLVDLVLAKTISLEHARAASEASEEFDRLHAVATGTMDKGASRRKGPSDRRRGRKDRRKR